MAEVRMPKMGDGMEEGTILRWLKREGESVQLEESIAEVETDKANVEIPAEEAGTLTAIVVEAGATVPVGSVIAHIGDVAAGAPPSGTAVPRAAAADASVVLVDSRPVPTAPRVRSSPLARAMARRLGIDIGQIVGTGGGIGRVVASDVLGFAEHVRASGESVSKAGPASDPTPAQTSGVDAELSKMRRAIARRTVLSKQTVPHFYLTMPIDMERAVDLLAQLNALTPADKVTLNDLVVGACSAALSRHPDVNVSMTGDDRIRRHDKVNIGIAVGTDDGLRIPVVVDCARFDLRGLAREVRRLVGRTRSGSVTPREMSGGTFTVSNLGMLGVEEFGAIVNPPESAILAVGAMAPEAVVDASGAIVVRKRMRVTLSCDHRTVDGVLGARFLQEIQRLLEHPVSLL